MRALVAGRKPPSNPFKNLRATSCHGVAARAIRVLTAAMETPARSSITFCPNRSPTAPQTGAISPPERKLAP